MARALLVLLLASACMPRVALPPLPERDAPLEVRIAAEQALAPVPQPVPFTSATGRVFATRPLPFLTLGNGQDIWNPLDLVPVVLPGSPTALEAGRYDDRVYYGSITMLAGLALALSGFGEVAAGAIGLGARGPLESPVLITGMASMALGGIALGVGTFIWAWATGAQSQAFKHYPADLKAALGL